MPDDAASRGDDQCRAGGRARGGAAPGEVADDRRGLQGARAGVPGHLDLEDPLPRGPEAAAPRRTPGGYRLYCAGRRLAAAHDPAPAARRVPAAARDPPGAGGGPHARRRGAAPARPAPAGAADGAPGRRAAAAHVLAARPRARCTRSRTCVEETGAEPRLVAELEEYGIVKGERARRHALLRRDRARDRARGRRARPLRRRRAATCACSGPRPSARRRCCSRSSPRRCARATRSGARRRSRRSRTSPRSPRT